MKKTIYLLLLLILVSCSGKKQESVSLVKKDSLTLLDIRGDGDFGTLVNFVTKIKTISIKNNNEDPMTLNPEVSGDEAYSLVFHNCNNITFENSCVVKLQASSLNKLTPGSFAGVLKLSNDLEVPLSMDVDIESAVAGYDFIVSGNSTSLVDFGSINGRYGMIKTVIVRNMDTQIPEVLNFSLEKNNEIKIMFNNCQGRKLKLKEKCMMKLIVAPLGSSSGVVSNKISHSGKDLNIQVSFNIPPQEASSGVEDMKFFESNGEVSSFNFGVLEHGNNVILKNIIIKNMGTGTSGLMNLSLTNPNYQILFNNCNRPIMPGNSCLIKVAIDGKQYSSPNSETGNLVLGNSTLAVTTRVVNPDRQAPIISTMSLNSSKKYPEAVYTSLINALGSEITDTVVYSDENAVNKRYSLSAACDTEEESLSNLSLVANQENELFVRLFDDANYSTGCISMGKIIHDNIVPKANVSALINDEYTTSLNSLPLAEFNFNSLSSESDLDLNYLKSEISVGTAAGLSDLSSYKEFVPSITSNKITVSSAISTDLMPNYRFGFLSVRVSDKAGNYNIYSTSNKYLMTSNLHQSCENIYSEQPSATSSQYYIDVDGSGTANSPIKVLCDKDSKNKTFFALKNESSYVLLNNGSSLTNSLGDFAGKATTSLDSKTFSGVLNLKHQNTIVETQLVEFAGGTYGTTNYCDNVADSRMCMVRFNGNVILNGVHSPAVRKKGFVIYVDGDLTINSGASISMSARGAIAVGQDLRLVGSYAIPAAGAGGGTGLLIGDGRHSLEITGGQYDNHSMYNILQGLDGINGQTGGGAAGGGINYYGYSARGGNGAAGTSYSGGSGGGGSNSRSCNARGGHAQPNGGAGGTAHACWDWGAYSGTGNPVGSLNSNNGYEFYTANPGTGGLLVIYVKGNLLNNGSIQANGVSNSSNGGASGGGSVNVFYTGTLSGTGTATANGGSSTRRAGNGTVRLIQTSF